MNEKGESKINNRALATKIFERLILKGAKLGNASIIIIESVLDEEVGAYEGVEVS